MKNDEKTAKFEIGNSKFGTDWPAQVLSFGFLYSFVIRHSDFVI